MKNVMLGLATILMMTVSAPAMAVPIILDGDATGNGVNTTALLNDGAYVDGTPNLPKALYSQEFAISGVGDGTSFGTIAISDIPVFDDGGLLFFTFIFDSQEAGTPGAQSISLDDFVVSVGLTEYWNYTGMSIILNDATANDATFSPLGNGSDMSLFVPVSLFYGAGLIGSDILTFTWTQTLSSNGKDEWVTVGDGFFEDDDPVCDPQDPDCNPGQNEIPEPTTIALFGMGLLGYAAMRRRRRSQLKA